MRPTDALPHPTDWRTTTVRRSVELRRGVSWSKEQEHAEPAQDRMPVIGIKNVQSRLELNELLYLSRLQQSDVEKGRVSADWTVLVGSNGNRDRIGNAVLINHDADFLFASFLVGAKPKSDSGLRPDYFFRWISTEQVQSSLSASAEGTTGLSNLSHSFLKNMSIPVPSLGEQAAIARILDAVDTALERTRAAVERAWQLKKAVLDRFLYEALGETMCAHRPRRQLPDGWALVSAGRLLAGEPKNGMSPPTSSIATGIPTFSIGAIRNGRVDLQDPKHLKYVSIPEDEASNFGIRQGDVLIVRGNANPDLVGKAGIVSTFPAGCIYPDIAKRVLFQSSNWPKLLPEFGALVWNHAMIHNQLLRRAKTSNGTLKINSRDVKEVVLPVPPESEQEQVVEILAAADNVIDGLKIVSAAQEDLKKSLMHGLLTGQVRVGHARKMRSP